MQTIDIVNTARPGFYSSTVVENRTLSARYYLLVLSRPRDMSGPTPGTFVHVGVPEGGRFFLRRPFSVLDADEDRISLLIVEKGEGTQILRRLEHGSHVDLIGPLGSSFPAAAGKRVLAIGGGVGLAPLYYYRTHGEAANCAEYRLLYGARTREDLFVDRFEWDAENVGFASEDGSYGFHGNVVALAAEEIERVAPDMVFSCGPNAMLKAAQELAAKHGIKHFVSLENRMACALGACRSCVVLTKNGADFRYRTVCNDGPVFDADMLVWEELPQA